MVQKNYHEPHHATKQFTYSGISIFTLMFQSSKKIIIAAAGFLTIISIIFINNKQSILLKDIISGFIGFGAGLSIASIVVKKDV